MEIREGQNNLRFRLGRMLQVSVDEQGSQQFDIVAFEFLHFGVRGE